MVNWDCNKKDRRVIAEIVKRAAKIYKEAKVKRDPVDIDMDVTACHVNGNPLDLPKLLAAPEFDFMHDIGGIAKHIDRETGELKDHFLPRCSKK